MTAEKSLEKIADYMRDISRHLKRIESLLESGISAKEDEEFNVEFPKQEDDLK